MSAPLLIHSLAEFRALIFECIELVEPRKIVEIGSENGTFTKELLQWARDHGATVTAVEPLPTPAVTELADGWPEMHLVEERSPKALQQLEPADVYLVDGDHNYATLSGELETIDASAGERPFLAFLHDVGWPSGRRDMYYDPSSLPADAVHPHTYAKGVVPGCGEVADGGFRGAGQFAWARREGGPANGVRTAVEDFLSRQGDRFSLVTVPCVFGLGVLFPRSAPWAAALDALLAPYDQNSLLARMEENRLSLYLAVLELQDDRARALQRAEQLQLERRDVDAENRALWARVAELEQSVAQISQQMEVRVQTLHNELDALVRSRALGVVELLSRAKALAIGRETALSRRRLRGVLESTDGA